MYLHFLSACELYGLLGGIFGLLSINTNAAIALDRYFVICQPVQSMQRMTKRRAAVIIIFLWFWCVLWSLLPVGGFGAYIPEGFQTSCTFDYLTRTQENLIFTTALYISGFVIPLLVIVGCYYKIVRAVAAHEREMAKMAEKLGAKDMRSGADLRTDLKTAKVSFTICLLWLMSWGPYSLIAFCAILGHTAYLNPYVSELPVIFAKTSAMYNPLVYAISHPKFRYAMEKQAPFLFACCKTKKPLTRGSTTGGSRMSQSSDIGSVRRSESQMTQMKAVSTSTIATVAGKVDEEPTPAPADTADAKTGT